MYGGFNACAGGVGKAWISTLVPDRAQDTAQGLYQGLNGIGILLAGLWAGLAWGTDGRLPLISGTCAAALALALVTYQPGRR